MGTAAALATLVAIAGCVLADDHSHHDHTANLVASPSVASEAVYPSSQGQAAAVDPNLYYNNYQQVDPYNGGYYDYDTADTGFSARTTRTDKTSVTPLAGLSFAALVPIVTIFSAAMAGSLLAPAVSSAARSMFAFMAEIPNIEINMPGIVGTTEEENEVARSLGASSGLWARLLTNVASNLAQEFNTKYKGKFQKFLANDSL